MNLSYFTLRRLSLELNETLTGKRIHRAVISGTHELVLETNDGILLFLSASPATGRLQFVRRLPTAAQPLPPWVEHHLLNSVIREVSQIPLERILSFTTRKRDRLGGERRYRLFVELINRRNDVILTSEPDQRILGSLRWMDGKVNRQRRILPGQPYRPPPAQDRISPSDLTPADLASAFAQQTDQPVRTLANAVAGLDILTAASLIAEAGINRNSEPASEACEFLASRIHSVFARPPFLEKPEILSIPDSPPSIRVLKLKQGPGEVKHVCTSVSEAIERLVESEEDRQHVNADRRAIVAELNRRLTSLKNKIGRIQADLDDTENAELYRKYGHILMAGLHRIRLGDASVTLPDVYDPAGSPATIPLRTNKLPHENAAAYLKRSRKAEKARPILTRRLKTTRAELATVEGFLELLDKITSQEELTVLRDKLTETGWLKSRRRKQVSGRNVPSESYPRRYRTSDGWTVLVGRNNVENDSLTKASAKDDLFFHAQGCPGSHVILKREGKHQGPSNIALMEAASLAAYWSKARHSKTVPVNYTEVRYVQKPRGGAPGLVTIRNEITLFAAPRQLKRTES